MTDAASFPAIEVWVRGAMRRIVFAELPDGRVWWVVDGEHELVDDLSAAEFDDVDWRVKREIRHRQNWWRERHGRGRGGTRLRVVGGGAA